MTHILPASTRTKPIAPAVMTFDNLLLTDTLTKQLKSAFPSLAGVYDLRAYTSQDGDTLILATQGRLTMPFVLHKDGTVTQGLSAAEAKTFQIAMASDNLKNPEGQIAKLKEKLVELKNTKKTILENLQRKNDIVDGLGNPMTAKEVYGQMVDNIKSAIHGIEKAQKNFVGADDRRSVTF